MTILGQLLIFLLEIYSFIIIASVIVSWLLAFNVLSTQNPHTRNLLSLLGRLTDPVMRPVQKYIPPIGGIDITPIVIIFGIMILQRVVATIFFTGYMG